MATERALRVRVFALTWLAYAGYYLTRKNFSVAKKTLERELSISRAALGAIDTGYLAAYAAGQIAWGLVGDRVGARRVLALGMLATAACSVAFGLSSTALAFAMAFGVNGVAQSSGWPACVKAMGDWFPSKGRAGVMGVWATCYQVGSLVANPVAAAFIAVGSWRTGFFGPAILVGALGLVMLALPDRRSANGIGIGIGNGNGNGNGDGNVWRSPSLWVIGAAYFFLKLTRYVLLFWLPYFMEDALHYSTSRAAGASLAFEVGGAIGAIAVGLASDRLFAGRRLGVSMACLVALAAALPLFAWAAPRGLAANVAALALVGFCLFGPDTLLSGAAAQDAGGARAAATAAGIINGFGSLGAVAQGPLTAAVSGRLGWATLFSSLGVAALASVAILLPLALARGRQATAASPT